VNNASQVTGNSFIKHSYEALYYYGGFPLDARNNYWGHQTGPYNPNDTDTLHQVNNGGGGEVSENVYFVPFANAPLYNSASKPVITSVEPPFSPRAGGGTAMIYGRQMLKGVKVFFGKDTIKTVQYGASDVIAVVVPPGRGGPVDVIVQNPNGKVDTLKRGFFYENHPPLGVALSSPSMGSTVTTGRPTFKWQKVIDPDGDEVVYSFVISKSEFFEDSISVVGIADTFYLLKDTTLSPNTSYFWRIVASDTREGYSTSPIGQFTTSNILSIDDEKKIPLTYELHQNYPNPFNPITTIRFDLPHSRNVMIEVFDILGRRVTVLANGIIDAGYHSIVWNGRNQNSETISSGVYFYRITAGNYVKTRRMLMLK
jgi:hypothetical protein